MTSSGSSSTPSTSQNTNLSDEATPDPDRDLRIGYSDCLLRIAKDRPRWFIACMDCRPAQPQLRLRDGGRGATAHKRYVPGARLAGALVLLSAGLCLGHAAPPQVGGWLAPCALAATSDGRTLYTACAHARQVVVVEAPTGKVTQTIPLEGYPTGLALVEDPTGLLVTSSGATDSLILIDRHTGKRLARHPAGHGPCSPVISRQRHVLYVCNRFDHTVTVHELGTLKEIARMRPVREPVAAALTPDERLLVVANHLPNGPANAQVVTASVTIVDAISFVVRTNLLLPNGSTSLRGVAISPDGRFCCVAHNLARFQVPTTQVEQGWMNDSALSLIDLENVRLVATVLMDDPKRGAANPWATAWASDGRTICVTHSGTHELSLIDADSLVKRLSPNGTGELVSDLTVLRGIRKRVTLTGNGPRALALAGGRAYVAEYFSDSVSAVDLTTGTPVSSVRLGSATSTDPVRTGEMLFHDATMSYQSWQSCASCHPDARADGLNWDLLNDGIGNPKNTKSLVLSEQTPPAMSLGVRLTTQKAVRSGLRSILFAVRPEAEARAIDEYLRSIRPAPNPNLRKGRLSKPAQRGQRVYADQQVGCATCHPAPLFTDQKSHDVGTGNVSDRPGERFDTPTLVECWRTAPYLHDGSAATIRDVLTTRNRQTQHGATSGLTPQQLEDLIAYVLSL